MTFSISHIFILQVSTQRTSRCFCEYCIFVHVCTYLTCTTKNKRNISRLDWLFHPYPNNFWESSVVKGVADSTTVTVVRVRARAIIGVLLVLKVLQLGLKVIRIFFIKGVYCFLAAETSCHRDDRSKNAKT